MAAGIVGGILAAAGHALWIGRYEKGLHKAGAIAHAGGAALLLGLLTGLALIPVLLRVSHALLRRTLLAAGILGVLLFSAAAGRWSSEHSIRAADQAALDAELKNHFKYGIPQVYYAQDLRFLQGLANKYKDTQVDLKPVNDAVAFQIALRAKLARQQKEFEAKVREIVFSEEPAGRKRAQLTKLANDYRLMGVDLKPAEKALENLPADHKRGIGKRAPRTSRISITSAESAPPARPRPGRAVKPLPAPKGSGSKAANQAPPKKEPKKSPFTGRSKRWW